MPCLFLVLGLAFPRVILVLLYLFTHMLQRAYSTFLIPLLGFVFLPLTTLMYAWMVNTGLPIAGFYLVALVICVVADLGLLGGGARSRGRFGR